MPLVEQSGADVLVAGNTVFNSDPSDDSSLKILPDFFRYAYDVAGAFSFCLLLQVPFLAAQARAIKGKINGFR